MAYSPAIEEPSTSCRPHLTQHQERPTIWSNAIESGETGMS